MLPIFRCVLSGRITNMLAYLYLCACFCIVYSTTINTQKCANQITTRRNHLKNKSVDMFMKDLQGTCSVVNETSTYPENFVIYSKQFLDGIQKFKEAMAMKRKIADQVKLILEDTSLDHEYQAIYDAMLQYSTSMCLVTDCQEIKYRKTGINRIYIKEKPITILCEMDTDGGNWTVIQLRQDGSVDFFRNWQEYKEGFGDSKGEFWLGNENIHKLTSGGRYELRVDLRDWEGNSWYAVYSEFKISNEHDNYRLSVGGYKGTAGDSLGYHNQGKFSTKDQDNDDDSSRSCSNAYKGAWWYKSCHLSNLNGLYQKGDGIDRVTWWHAKKKALSMKFARMMIRRY